MNQSLLLVRAYFLPEVFDIIESRDINVNYLTFVLIFESGWTWLMNITKMSRVQKIEVIRFKTWHDDGCLGGHLERLLLFHLRLRLQDFGESDKRYLLPRWDEELPRHNIPYQLRAPVSETAHFSLCIKPIINAILRKIEEPPRFLTK